MAKFHCHKTEYSVLLDLLHLQLLCNACNYCKKAHLMSSVNVYTAAYSICSFKTIVTTKQCFSTVQVTYRKTTQHNKIQITKYKKMQNTVGCSLVEVSCGETIQHNGRRCLSMSYALSASLLI